MPTNREPAMYQGYVISQIGTSAGQKVPMELKNAQACVSSGTHRWADDPTDMSNVLRMEIQQREDELAAQVEADRLHNEEQKRLREEAERGAPKSVADAIARAARPVRIDTVGEDIFLQRPLPQVTMIDKAMFESEAAQKVLSVVEVGEGDMLAGDIILRFANASGWYRKVSETETHIIAELQEADEPEVDIPANWREMSHLKQIPMAKAIRGTKEAMKKPEAIAILEEWTKVDDQVRTEEQQPGEAQPGAGKSEEGNRDGKPFQDKDGNEISPEEAAQRKAADFIEDDFGA